MSTESSDAPDPAPADWRSRRGTKGFKFPGRIKFELWMTMKQNWPQYQNEALDNQDVAELLSKAHDAPIQSADVIAWAVEMGLPPLPTRQPKIVKAVKAAKSAAVDTAVIDALQEGLSDLRRSFYGLVDRVSEFEQKRPAPSAFAGAENYDLLNRLGTLEVEVAAVKAALAALTNALRGVIGDAVSSV